VRELASFAFSDAGKVFARIEERWGRDPAAALQPHDDFLAHNLRAALMVSLAEEPEQEVDEGERHLEMVAQAHDGSERLRRMLGE